MAAANTESPIKLIIFGDPQRPNVAEAVEEFIDFIDQKAQILANCFRGDCAVDLLSQADYAVVFGGDGTILSAARDLSDTDVPVIGINVGKLGFLAEFSVEELKNLFDRVVKKQLVIEKRMILQCTVLRDGKDKFSSTAINDVVICAGPPFNMIELKMTVEKQQLAGCVSDGLIISTPTGSTAYNLSCGGPILAANLAAIVITPLSPHSLSFRPIVINAQNFVDVIPVRVNSGTALLLDGVVSSDVKIGDVIRISRHKGAFLVVNNPLRTQWDALASKLSWAGMPKYYDRYKK
ncbi:MAG: NAD(+)/NADH kinase [Planctomycetota bacterium]